MTKTPKMSRSHYAFLAAQMKSREPNELNTLAMGKDFNLLHERWKLDCISLSYALIGTNPRYRRDKFIAACGVEE